MLPTGAYAACERVARAHYENFPVASCLLPGAMRPHVAAVYAFARSADDFADEGGRSPSERLALLDEWHERLRAAVGGDAASPGSRRIAIGGVPIDADQIFTALAHTIEICSVPPALLEDLLSAFRQDVTVHRYAGWDDVLDYCRRSANPVGRIVLRIAGYRDGTLDEASDALCSALQLTNFWQDLAIDWSRGRLYMPLAERDAAGASDDDLDARHMSRAWQTALARAAAVTRTLFTRGRPVCDGVGGRLRLELRATWLGAVRVLERLERAGFDVFSSRPTLGAADVPSVVWGLLTWRALPADPRSRVAATPRP